MAESESYVAREIRINLIMPGGFNKQELGRSTARWLRERQRGKLLSPVMLNRQFGDGQFYLRLQAAVPETSEVATRSPLLVHGLEGYLMAPLCIERVIVGDVESLDMAVHTMRKKKLAVKLGQ